MATQIGIETAIEMCREANSICTEISTAGGYRITLPLDKRVVILILQAYVNGGGRFSELEDEVICYRDGDGTVWLNSKYGA